MLINQERIFIFQHLKNTQHLLKVMVAGMLRPQPNMIQVNMQFVLSDELTDKELDKLEIVSKENLIYKKFIITNLLSS